MNAIDLLKEDHDVVDGLFKRIEETPPSRHPPILKRIKAELDTHAHIEEKLFYPDLIKKGKKDLRDITKEGLEEHAQMKKFLNEAVRATDKEKRETKIKVLIEDTRHHVKEEENEMFPMVRDQFSREALEDLGMRMETEKARFQRSKGITPRRQPPKGMIEKAMDKAKDIVSAVRPEGDNGFTGKSTKSAKAKTKSRAAAK
jgi:iron-sulfur cluster repair protein YtfE (RIC family)